MEFCSLCDGDASDRLVAAVNRCATQRRVSDKNSRFLPLVGMTNNCGITKSLESRPLLGAWVGEDMFAGSGFQDF